MLAENMHFFIAYFLGEISKLMCNKLISCFNGRLLGQIPMNKALTKFLDLCLELYAQALMEISRFRKLLVKANKISSKSVPIKTLFLCLSSCTLIRSVIHHVHVT